MDNEIEFSAETYYKHMDGKRVAISAADVPKETGLVAKEFPVAERGSC